jgi:hypothetical protein
LLRYLVEHAGRLVTQDEILEVLWPETYVNSDVIRKYIQEIRKVLGDLANEPAFIATLPKRGYQFVAPVIEESNAMPSDLPIAAANKIVGREPALAELDRCFSKAVRGQRQIVLSREKRALEKPHWSTNSNDGLLPRFSPFGSPRAVRGRLRRQGTILPDARTPRWFVP